MFLYCRVYKQISSGNTSHNRFIGDFYRHSIKIWKFRPIFSSFNPCSFSAIGSNRWQETVSMPSIALNNKPGHIIFGIQLIRRKFLGFLKLKHWTTNNYRRSGLRRGVGTLICEQFLQGPTWTNSSEGKLDLGVTQDQQYRITPGADRLLITLIKLKVLQF